LQGNPQMHPSCYTWSMLRKCPTSRSCLLKTKTIRAVWGQKRWRDSDRSCSICGCQCSKLGSWDSFSTAATDSCQYHFIY